MALIMIHGTDHTFRQTGHVEFVVAYVGCHIGARSSPNVFSSVLEWPVEENRLTKFVFRINQKQKSRVHLNPKTLLRFHLVRMHFLTIYCCRYCFFFCSFHRIEGWISCLSIQNTAGDTSIGCFFFNLIFQNLSKPATFPFSFLHRNKCDNSISDRENKVDPIKCLSDQNASAEWEKEKFNEGIQIARKQWHTNKNPKHAKCQKKTFA